MQSSTHLSRRLLLVIRNLDSLDSLVNSLVAGRGTPFQGPRVGSCLTLRNELFEETHVLTKQETLLGRGTGQRAGG